MRRLWFPLLLLALFIPAAIFETKLLASLGTAPQYPRAIIEVGLWLSVALALNRVLHVFVWDSLARRMLGAPIPRLIRDVVAVLILLATLTGIVGQVFHYPVTGIWATSGAFGVVIGLALQNVILDVFIGLAINFDKPFQLGDYIQLPQANQQGKVIEINWRTIRLLTDEDNIVIVPNRRIGDMVVMNLSVPTPAAELDLTLSLDHGVSPERALRVLLAGILAVAGTNDLFELPKPRARIKGVSAFGVDYLILFHYDPGRITASNARNTALKSILEQLRIAGLTPAYPKQDLFHAPLPQRQFDTRALDDRVQVLSRVELFASLQAEDLRELALHMQQRTFRDGERVIRQGDPGQSMFILLEGLLHVLIGDDPAKRTRVAQLTAGQFFGEMSLLTGEARSATVVAATDAFAYEITKAEVEALFQRRPETIQTISHAVAQRKLRNEAHARSREEEETAEASLTQQLVSRIRSFFGGQQGPQKAAGA